MFLRAVRLAARTVSPSVKIEETAIRWVGMMKISSLISPIVLVVSVVALGACSGQESPLALQTIDPNSPVLDEVPTLNESRAAGPVTLYSAIIAQGVPSKVAKKAFEKYDKFS